MRVTCPYCTGDAELVGGEAIYPHRPDLFDRRFWLCRPCKAWVGTHRDSRKAAPLGRLANAELRRAKQAAHAAFDPKWKRGGSRRKAYAWLAAELGLAVEDCHIGRFDLETCRRVVEACKRDE